MPADVLRPAEATAKAPVPAAAMIISPAEWPSWDSQLLCCSFPSACQSDQPAPHSLTSRYPLLCSQQQHPQLFQSRSLGGSVTGWRHRTGWAVVLCGMAAITSSQTSTAYPWLTSQAKRYVADVLNQSRDRSHKVKDRNFQSRSSFRSLARCCAQGNICVRFGHTHLPHTCHERIWVMQQLNYAAILCRCECSIAAQPIAALPTHTITTDVEQYFTT